MLEGAEYLAARGIVPLLSVWMPPAGSVNAAHRPPGLDYYRQARREFARLYRQHGLRPPGIPAGSHVSICGDIYRHMVESPSRSDATAVAVCFDSRCYTQVYQRPHPARPDGEEG